MGTIEQRRPGVYRLRAYVGRDAKGNPKFLIRTVYGPKPEHNSGLRLAQRELAKLVTEVDRRRGVVTGVTVAELLDRFLDHCQSIGRSPTTLRGYRQIADKTLKPEIGKVKLSRLSAHHLDVLYGKMTAKGNSAATVRRTHALIGAALRQAERWGWVDRCVARQASPPPVRQKPIKSPSLDQVASIVTAAEDLDPTLAAMLLVAALTGARRGELCALRWTDVDLADNLLQIGRSVYEMAGGGWAEKDTKSHQGRRIALDPLAAEVFHRHRARVLALANECGLQVRPDGFVFSRSPVGSEPIRPDLVTGFMTRVAKATGIPVHLHQLRHFSATQLIAAGYDPVTVAARHGHADPSVTMRIYAHALEQRDRAAAAALGQLARDALEKSGAVSSQTAQKEPLPGRGREGTDGRIHELDTGDGQAEVPHEPESEVGDRGSGGPGGRDRPGHERSEDANEAGDGCFGQG
jgi:integrase